MEASYKAGTETMVNVLNQQQKLFESQTEYATDRYAFVNNMLLLKQAAGTLSFDDLHALNNWLSEDDSDIGTYHRKKMPHYSQGKFKAIHKVKVTAHKKTKTVATHSVKHKQTVATKA